MIRIKPTRKALLRQAKTWADAMADGPVTFVPGVGMKEPSKRMRAAVWAGLAEVAAQEAVTPVTPVMGRKALWKATHCRACGQLLPAKTKAAAKRKGNA